MPLFGKRPHTLELSQHPEHLQCPRCRAESHEPLTKFTMLRIHPLDESRGWDTMYWLWQCQECTNYYLREWIIQWKGELASPAMNQLVVTHKIERPLAIRLVSLAAQCPNASTRTPEKCDCELHELLPFALGLPAVFMHGCGAMVDRFAFPEEKLHDLLDFGVNEYVKPYLRKRRT